ncbi:MAG TPA: sulfotransferase [Edaphocola sp.]|nr:sulfotransferase [Edaphocola sp.]
MVNRPNFLIVGVPKGGTSSLYEYLKDHPAIYLPEQKELHFFTYNELKKNTRGPGDKLALATVIKTWGDYLKYYSNMAGEKMAGDVSPSYFYFSKAIVGDIKDQLGINTKIIIMLRDPIERAYSNYLHQKRLMHEKLDFQEALEREEERIGKRYGDFWRYKDHSFYAERCLDYINTFGEKNVKIVIFEDMVKHTQATVKSILDFLEVDSTVLSYNIYNIYNKGGVHKENMMTKFLLKPSFFKELVRRILGKRIGKLYKRYKLDILNMHSEAKPEIDDRTIAYLQDYFSNDVKRLKEMGVNINEWKYF